MLQRLLDTMSAARHQRRADRITLASARSRAARGSAYLDMMDPGWRTRINASTLELADGAHCVLGQLHGEFRAGLLRTRVWDGSSAPSMRLFNSVSPEDLGFRAVSDSGDELAALDYAFLNRAWREEIAESAPVPAPVSAPLAAVA